MTVEPRQDVAKRLPRDVDVARFVAGQTREDGLTVGEIARFAGAEIQVTFAARLKFAREREKRSVGETARAAGVSHTTIRNWENGVEPRDLTAGVLANLAEFLHVTPEWLEDGIGTEGPGPVGSSTAGGTVNAEDVRALLSAAERVEDQIRSAEDLARQLIRKAKAILGG
jgi:transcriptional regulator with XRE-family HTH domain